MDFQVIHISAFLKKKTTDLLQDYIYAGQLPDNAYRVPLTHPPPLRLGCLASNIVVVGFK
jgi:hypothetical protein